MWNGIPNLIALSDGSLFSVYPFNTDGIKMHISHCLSFNLTVKGHEKF